MTRRKPGTAVVAPEVSPPEVSADESDEMLEAWHAEARSVAISIASAGLALVSYLGLGSLCFRLLEPSWSVIDAVYFCMVTCSTVGYGDLSPSNNSSRWFALLMIMIGIALVFPRWCPLPTGLCARHGQGARAPRQNHPTAHDRRHR